MSDQHEKLIALLVQKLNEKKPANTRLTVDACIQVFAKKFAEKFQGVEWEAKKGFIQSCITKCEGGTTATTAVAAPNTGSSKPSAPPAKAKPAAAKKKKRDEDSDDEDEDDSDDESEADSSEDDDDDEKSEDDDEEDEEEDEEDELADDVSDSDEEGEEAEAAGDQPKENAGEGKEDQPTRKKHRKDKGGDEASTLEIGSNAHICQMARFLRKLDYRIRKPEDNEDLTAYRDKVLTPVFEKHRYDTTKVSNADIVKARMRKELDFLTSEADVNLAKESRRGRARFGGDSGGGGSSQPQAAAAPRAEFLDDD